MKARKHHSQKVQEILEFLSGYNFARECYIEEIEERIKIYNEQERDTLLLREFKQIMKISSITKHEKEPQGRCVTRRKPEE